MINYATCIWKTTWVVSYNCSVAMSIVPHYLGSVQHSHVVVVYSSFDLFMSAHTWHSWLSSSTFPHTTWQTNICDVFVVMGKNPPSQFIIRYPIKSSEMFIIRGIFQIFPGYQAPRPPPNERIFESLLHTPNSWQDCAYGHWKESRRGTWNGTKRPKRLNDLLLTQIPLWYFNALKGLRLASKNLPHFGGFSCSY